MRCICKNGNPLIYLPEDRAAARETLRLYPAQSRAARLVKRMLDVALAAGLPLPLKKAAPPEFDLDKVRWLLKPDALTASGTFESQRMGVFAGNPRVEGRRYLFLICDARGRAICLAKVGFDPKAVALIRAEREFLKAHTNRPGLPVVLGEYESGSAEGFVIPFYRGSHPREAGTSRQIAELLGSWAADGEVTLGEIPAWSRLGPLQECPDLDEIRVRRVIGHGDFAPWNVLVDDGGQWRVIDWERGESSWVPGWDWFHYVLLPLMLVEKASAEEILLAVEGLIRSGEFASYAQRMGIGGIERELFAAYLRYFKEIIRPTETTETLDRLISLTAQPRKSSGNSPDAPSEDSVTGTDGSVRDIVAVMQTPPPAHGQAIMNQYFLEGNYRRIRLHHVRMAFSEEIEEVGGFSWKKVRHLFSVLVRIIAARLRTKDPVLYYPPASPNMIPFLRDCVLLICTRWMFPQTVFHFHANGISEFYGKLPAALRFLYRLAYSRPDLSICLTRYATDDARHFESRRIEVIANGIPDEAASGTAPARSSVPDIVPTLLFLSTVSREKGAGVLLEALSMLRKRGLAFRCVIAGQFASKEEEVLLRNLAGSIGISDVIEWKGEVYGKEKEDCYRGADIFCFPSHYATEGLPVVLLEAMMFGLPMVSTRWRGIPDIVEDGVNGRLVPTRDPATLADSLQELVAEPLLSERMGAAARRRYEERFTVRCFREAMDDTLGNLLKPTVVSARDIVMVAQTPPPAHGQAVMNRLLLDGSYRDIRLHHVKMAFSEEIKEVGAFRWRKLPYLIGLVFRIVAARFRTRAPVLYYPPASPNMVPFLRDCVILLATRWMFPRTAFHFHAAGISGLYPHLPAVLKLLYRAAYFSPDLSVCVTRYATDDARHFGSRRIEIVPNGIPDLAGQVHGEGFEPRSDSSHNRQGPPTILFLSAVSEEKGVGVLLEALAELQGRHVDFRCKIVGKPLHDEEMEGFRKYAREHALDARIDWLDELQNREKTTVYSESDIFCFPSYYSAESFGLVVLEAMMFSLPVVATEWRGLREIVEDGRTGFLVPVRDPVVLADRLGKLIADPTLRHSMGKEGRKRYERNYTVREFREKMERALRDAAGGGSAAGRGSFLTENAGSEARKANSLEESPRRVALREE